MKKICSILCACSLLLCFGLSVYAETPAAPAPQQTIVKISENEYYIVTVTQNDVAQTRATSTINATKDYTYVLNNTAQWKFSVAGAFQVTKGISSTCTGAYYAFTPYVSGWMLSSHSTRCSGNTATASGTVTGSRTVYPTVSVSCDANGNIS